MLAQETIAALIVSALGAAVVWGSTKNRVDAMQTSIDKLENKVDNQDRDLRTQSNQISELSVKMSLLYEETRTIKRDVKNILTCLQQKIFLDKNDDK